MTDFNFLFDGVFVGAMIGAVTSLMFGSLTIPGSTDASHARRIVFTICYVFLAGYFARFVVQVQEPYQGFFVGLVLDVFLRKARAGARKWVNDFTAENVGSDSIESRQIDRKDG